MVKRKDKTIAILLAMVIMLSMVLPAMAADADPAADVLGRRVDETELPDGKTVSIGCLWGDEIRFTYHEQIALSDWDPETLAYRASSVASSGWTADTDNSIKVSNRSDTGVQIDFRWGSEPGYEHIKAGTSGSGFRLHAAEYGIEPDSRTVTAEVIEGGLEAGQEDYRLMGALILGVKAVDDALVDTGMETMSAAVPELYSYTASGAAEVPRGGTVKLSAMPEASVLEGDTFAWKAGDGAEVLTDAAKGGEPCGESSIDIKIGEGATEEIAVSCAIERASGQRLASSMLLAPVAPRYRIMISEAGEHGRAASGGTLATDGDGNVPALPGTVPDAGYMFDRWIDANGNTVQAGDALDHDITITPAFKRDGSYLISFVDDECGTVDDKTAIRTSPDGIVTGAFPSVTPETGYVLDKWIDIATKKEIKQGDKLAGDIIATPQFKDGDKSVDITFDMAKSNSTARLSTNITFMVERMAESRFSSVAYPNNYISGTSPKTTKTIYTDVLLTVGVRDPSPTNANERWCVDYVTLEREDGSQKLIYSTPSVSDTKTVTFEQPLYLDDYKDGENLLVTAHIEKYTYRTLSSPYTLAIADGDHGTAGSKASLKTDSYGIVPALPAATPDVGWKLAGWLDQDGRRIRRGDVIAANKTIHPIFAENRVFYVTPQEGEHYTLSRTNKINTTRVGVMWNSLPDVTPDAGYKFERWIDVETGREITFGSVLDHDILIKPIVVPA